MVTRETDSHIAKAYISLSDLPEAHEAHDLKMKAIDDSEPHTSSIEGGAVSQYLDDEEWEANERREGRGVNIPSFPFAAAARTVTVKENSNFPNSLWRQKS